MKISRICLGCMGFGSKDWRSWVLEDKEAKKMIEYAIDLGINFFDTANSYSFGESERILGSALEGHDRDRYVIATKVFNKMENDHPNSGGLSRKTIEQEIENSLSRLNLDSVDLYQTHRWDYSTPIYQTLHSLDNLVKRGRIRHTGASSMWCHQLANAIHTSELKGITSFSTMQNHYSLVYREEEREMIPYCRENNIGILPWSPLAKGFLTRPHSKIETTKRGTEDNLLHTRPYDEKGGKIINERVEEISKNEGVTMAQISLAWLLNKESVDAPIIGATKKEHLKEAVEALSINLSRDDMKYLEEPYEPLPIIGHK